MNAQHRIDYSLSEGPEPIPESHQSELVDDRREMVVFDYEKEDAWIRSDFHTSEVSIR